EAAGVAVQLADADVLVHAVAVGALTGARRLAGRGGQALRFAHDTALSWSLMRPAPSVRRTRPGPAPAVCRSAVPSPRAGSAAPPARRRADHRARSTACGAPSRTAPPARDPRRGRAGPPSPCRRPAARAAPRGPPAVP